jgi:nitrous oxide reductase accessory protein NosL
MALVGYTEAVEPTRYLYAVHSTRVGGASAVEVLFSSETEARTYAVSRSTDFHVLASVITRYVLGQLGTRHPVGWFVDGKPQDARAIPTGAIYPIEPHPQVPKGAGGRRLYPI